MSVRKVLMLIHRYLGIVLSLLFLMCLSPVSSLRGSASHVRPHAL
jgi:hypothetical protein